MIRERVIRMYVDDKALEFSGADDARTFQQALGRMAAYGLRAERNEGVEHIDLSVDSSGDITAAYYPTVEWQSTGGSESHAPFYALNSAIEAFKGAKPFVIGAVKTDGKYSYHS